MKMINLILSLFILAACNKGKNGNDTTPSLTFSDVTVNEGTGAATNVEVTLTMSQGTSKTVTVTYSTIEGLAKAGQDYTAASAQTVTFQPNETQKKIIIPVVADDLKEADEAFIVRVENPVNVILVRGS